MKYCANHQFICFQYHGENQIQSKALDIVSKVGCGLSLVALTHRETKIEQQ